MLRNPDPLIEREIRRACPDDLFPYWDPREQKWRIVKKAEKNIPGLTIYDPVRGRHLIVEFTVEDAARRPLELTMATAELVKQLLQERDWFSDPGKHCDKEDEREEREAAKARELSRLMQQEFWKKVWKFTKTHTVS